MPVNCLSRRSHQEAELRCLQHTSRSFGHCLTMAGVASSGVYVTARQDVPGRPADLGGQTGCAGLFGQFGSRALHREAARVFRLSCSVGPAGNLNVD
jgi:hypothetical protein